MKKFNRFLNRRDVPALLRQTRLRKRGQVIRVPLSNANTRRGFLWELHRWKGLD